MTHPQEFGARIQMLLALLVIPMSLSADAPAGWFLAGTTPNEFEVGLAEGASSGNSACLKSIVDEPSGFGTLMQQFSAADHRGKRLRLTATVKSLNVGGTAGIWMRIDGIGGQQLAFDNMSSRPIIGTTDWMEYELVLDVPEEGLLIAFGVFIDSAGEVKIDDLKFDNVGPDVAVTGEDLVRLQDQPLNLSFDE